MGVETISQYRGGKYSVSKPHALSAERSVRWGLGVMLGIYVAGDSGGFLNPAITFCFCRFMSRYSFFFNRLARESSLFSIHELRPSGQILRVNAAI